MHSFYCHIAEFALTESSAMTHLLCSGISKLSPADRVDSCSFTVTLDDPS